MRGNYLTNLFVLVCSVGAAVAEWEMFRVAFNMDVEGYFSEEQLGFNLRRTTPSSEESGMEY